MSATRMYRVLEGTRTSGSGSFGKTQAEKQGLGADSANDQQRKNVTPIAAEHHLTVQIRGQLKQHIRGQLKQ